MKLDRSWGESYMKKFILIILLSSTHTWSSSVEDLSRKIGEDVNSEIKKDEDKFRKHPARFPASVPVVEKIKTQEPSKLDKNIRQIGPNEW
jgi:hypothetical protein